MTCLRILHTEGSRGWGGQEIRILAEAAGLIGRGHDVRLAAPSGAQITVEAEKLGMRVHRTPVDRRSVTAARAFVRVLREVDPDVVITHSSSDSWLVSISTCFLRRRPPIVRTRHISTAVKPSLTNRWLYGRIPARVVTTGEALRRTLIDDLNLDPSRVISVPTGIDVARFVPGDRAIARRNLGLSERSLVGIVATLRSWKGHRFLLRAMTDSRLSEVDLVIVGDGPERPEIAQLSAQLGLGDRVVFAGQQDDVLPWLQALDIFVLPSTGNEGVPQALMQAMACGLPVVTTAVGAIPELVEDGVTGLVVSPQEPGAIADAILHLLNDHMLATQIAGEGRRQVLEKHRAAAMLDAMEVLLVRASEDHASALGGRRDDMSPSNRDARP